MEKVHCFIHSSTESFICSFSGSFSSPTLISTQTSYYSAQGEYHCLSMSSIDPILSTEYLSPIGDNSRQQSPLNLMTYSSKHLLTNKRNNSFNHIVFDLELTERINKSNNPYKLSEFLFNLTEIFFTGDRISKTILSCYLIDFLMKE